MNVDIKSAMKEGGKVKKFVLINNKEYEFVCGYRDDDNLRESFNELTEKTYGFDFRKWFDNGYWGNEYIPYSLLDGETIVANVSVNIMDFRVLGEIKRYIQIGTVMTDEDYRGRGLSRALMEKVIEEWEDQCEFIYLFANDTVLNFYPKFGFKEYKEYQCSLNISTEKSIEEIRKINIEDPKDKDILLRNINNKVTLSKFYNVNNTSLIMFYCIDFMKDNIYYIEDYDAIAICEYNEDKLLVLDIFTVKEIELEKVINALIKDNVKKVILGFTPNETSLYIEELVKEDNDTLFIRCKKENIFEKEKLMFPILSHA